MAHVRDDQGYWGNKIPRLVNYGKHGRLTIRSVKLFSDGWMRSLLGFYTPSNGLLGALGSWGAALLEPYTDRSDTSGLLLVEKAKLEANVRKFWKDGWQVVSELSLIDYLHTHPTP